MLDTESRRGDHARSHEPPDAGTVSSRWLRSMTPSGSASWPTIRLRKSVRTLTSAMCVTSWSMMTSWSSLKSVTSAPAAGVIRMDPAGPLLAYGDR
jgi:hypothetical protein